MNAINVKSEIKPLKEVLVHRPGKELLNLTPNTLQELLFDDIPFLKDAQAEHDEFVQILRDNDIEVFYLEDLMAETLDANPKLKPRFIKKFIKNDILFILISSLVFGGLHVTSADSFQQFLYII